MLDSRKVYSVRRPSVALAAGAAVGFLGGLIGLGGAEFRLPILIAAFGLLPHRAVRFNLLVSLITLTFAAATRLGIDAGIRIADHADVLLAMVSGGVIAAWVGAGALARVPPKRLMAIIASLLLVISLLLFTEAAHTSAAALVLSDHVLVRPVAGFLAGLAVGAVSSLLGVAGGEFIIPILIFIFGADIKTAGTLSLLISLPIVAIGVVRHRLTGHYRSRDVLRYLVVPMSVGSVIGAVVGGALSAAAPSAALKVLLGAILASSAFKLAKKR